MEAWMIGAIFIGVCLIVALLLSLRRSYKDDSLVYKKDTETQHVLQQKLDIEKIKATKKESSSDNGAIGGAMVAIITLVVIAVVSLMIFPMIDVIDGMTSALNPCSSITVNISGYNCLVEPLTLFGNINPIIFLLPMLMFAIIMSRFFGGIHLIIVVIPIAAIAYIVFGVSLFMIVPFSMGVILFSMYSYMRYV